MEEKDVVQEFEGTVNDQVEEVKKDIVEDADEVEVEGELNWKEAAKKLKGIHALLVKDFTIDYYFIKQEINKLRERFNSKERTPQLHAEITALVTPTPVVVEEVKEPVE